MVVDVRDQQECLRSEMSSVQVALGTVRQFAYVLTGFIALTALGVAELVVLVNAFRQ